MHAETAGLVLIMMPAFNRESFIAEAIDSVRSQTYPNWKLVIVDDGSTDQTVSIAKGLAQKDERIEIIELNHKGECHARNTALTRADSKTEFVAFLDSDDVWDSDLLQTLIESLRLHGNYVGSHGIARIVDTNGRASSPGKGETWPGVRKGIKGFFPRNCKASSPTDFSMLVYGNFVPIGATLVRRLVFDKVGAFNPQTFIYPDWEMWMRISSLGPFAFVNKTLYKYRIHEKNTPKPKEMIFAQEKQFFASIYNNGNLTKEQRKKLKRGFRFHQLQHSITYFKSSVKELMQGKLSSSSKEFTFGILQALYACAFRPLD